MSLIISKFVDDIQSTDNTVFNFVLDPSNFLTFGTHVLANLSFHRLNITEHDNYLRTAFSNKKLEILSPRPPNLAFRRQIYKTMNLIKKRSIRIN